MKSSKNSQSITTKGNEMNNNKQLGATLIKSMANLSTNQIKESILTSFMVYEQCIRDEESMPISQWFHFHDLVALMWGYYGDLDLYIDKMEERWKTTLEGFKSRADIESFVQLVGDSKEEHDAHLLQIKNHFNTVYVY
jgi:hypothetical protein